MAKYRENFLSKFRVKRKLLHELLHYEKKAFIGFNNGIVKTIDTQTWQEINSFKCENGIQEMTISPDGKKLAIFSGKNIEIWDTGKIKRISQLSGHEKSGYGIGFSEDGDYLISGSQDQTFKMWNLATGRYLDIS